MTLRALSQAPHPGLQIPSYRYSYMSGFPALFRVLLHTRQQEIGIVQEVFLKLKPLGVRRELSDT